MAKKSAKKKATKKKVKKPSKKVAKKTTKKSSQKKTEKKLVKKIVKKVSKQRVAKKVAKKSPGKLPRKRVNLAVPIYKSSEHTAITTTATEPEMISYTEIAPPPTLDRNPILNETPQKPQSETPTDIF